MRDVQKTLPPPRAETAPHLDVLSEVLCTVRLTGATFFSAEFRAPWGITSPLIDTVARTFQDPDAHLVLFHLVLEGRATARVEGEPDITLEAGDIVAFPQGHAHRVWQGRPGRWYDTAPAVRRALAGELQVTRTGSLGDVTRFVCGYFSCDRWASEVVLAGLPSMLSVSVRDGDRPRVARGRDPVPRRRGGLRSRRPKCAAHQALRSPVRRDAETLDDRVARGVHGLARRGTG